MPKAALPINEQERLKALQELDILDTEMEKIYQSLVELASAICETPIALVSLVDEDRQWFKAKVGLEAKETPRNLAFCAHAILDDGLFEVENATKDPRFSDNPLVQGEPRVIFYAGQPLAIEDELRLGTLCVIDHKPRVLSQMQKDALQRIGEQVVELFRVRLQSKKIKGMAEDLLIKNQQLLQLESVAKIGYWHFKEELSSISFSMGCRLGLGLNERSDLDLERVLGAFSPRDAKEICQGLKDCEQGRSFYMEKQVVTSGSSERWVAFLGLPRYGFPKEAFGVIQDISNTKAVIQDLLEARESAEKATAAKSRFLSNMSHEIRTPMNGILGYLDLLSETRLSGQQSEYLRVVKDSADSLMGIINDVLDISKLESGHFQLHYEPVLIQPLVEQVVALFKPAAKSRGNTLLVDLNLDDQWVMADSLRLRQIFANLVGNAVKFTEKGQIVLGGKRVDENTLSFYIKDSGVGIDPEHRERLFRPFEQLDSSRAQEFGGTGLGLAIVAQLVQKMGGAIHCESEKGLGCTFEFSVTAHRADQPGKGELRMIAKDSFEFEGLSVLVVEDHVINQELISKRLERMKVSFEVVSSGEEALERIQESRFDVVLMDINMPGMDGYETTRRIVKLRQGHIPPIYALSANAYHDDREKSKAAGMKGHLTKPFKKEDLARVFQEVLAEQRQAG